MNKIMRCLSLLIGLSAFAAVAEDCDEWKWDTSGRIEDPPTVEAVACSTTFDSRLCAIAYADPIVDGLLRFDSRLFVLEESEGIDFDSTKLGLFLIIQ